MRLRPTRAEPAWRNHSRSPVEQASAELTLIAGQLEAAYPDTNTNAGVRVEPGIGRDVSVPRHE